MLCTRPYLYLYHTRIFFERKGIQCFLGAIQIDGRIYANIFFSQILRFEYKMQLSLILVLVATIVFGSLLQCTNAQNCRYLVKQVQKFEKIDELFIYISPVLLF